MEDLIEQIKELVASEFTKEYGQTMDKTAATNKDKYAVIGEGVMRLLEGY